MALPTESFFAALRAHFPADFASTDAEDLATYGRDWTKVYAPAPSVIAFPRNTEEVARLVRLCGEHDVPIVPSGGRTGLSGGALAARGELVLSLERMRRMDPVDTLAQTVRVQAGAITEQVHAHCAPHGLTWPVDFASKGSSHVGGNIATNAGGVKVIRYGLTRQWVLGLEVVTPHGDILELNGALEKNNTGLDLRQLYIGSEGTLGIITEATLKLTRNPGALDVFLFATADLDDVLRLFAEARRGPFTIMAYEFFTDRCLARLRQHRKVREPFAAPASHYVLLEVETHDREALERWLESVLESSLVTDATLAQDSTQAAQLWSLREGISESLSATGLPHKNDISLPVSGLRAFCAEFEALFAQLYPDWEICLFGHIGDGNLHVNVMKPDGLDTAAFRAKTHESDLHLMELVRRHRGSVSAEHGIGVLKKEWLGHARSAEQIALLRAVKATLDPRGLLNPGKIFDA